MNPFPIAWTLVKANRLTSVLFVVLIAVAVALGVAITAQERALRAGSASAAKPFDLIVAAPGSRMEVLFSVVYLRPSAVEMLPNAMVTEIMSRVAEPSVALAAPLAFGDNVQGFPKIGTTTAFAEHLAGGPVEGRLFEIPEEVVIGAAVPFEIGATVISAHGTGAVDEGDHGQLTVVGRLPATNTVWDRAVLAPIEFTWSAHGLTNGHLDPDAPIGPPWDEAALGGVPAMVIVPETLPAAYGLRQDYRTDRSMAFFPAEVLAEVYGYLGDVRALMNVLAIATQVLVVVAILAGIVALMQLYRTRLAVLRALGATRAFVFAVMWVYVMSLILGGAVLGVAGGWATAGVVSAIFAAETGLTLQASLGRAELMLVGALIALGAILAALPAWALFRKPPVTFLR